MERVYSPHGFNFGMNVGKAGGAGVAGHLHLHAMPRWAGDTNFMTTSAKPASCPKTRNHLEAHARSPRRRTELAAGQSHEVNSDDLIVLTTPYGAQSAQVPEGPHENSPG